MAKIEIYSSLLCPYCYRAKALLKKKHAAFDEIMVDGRPKVRSEMIERAGGRTSVPQVFIDGRHVGGSDELYQLDADGRLDPMLAGQAA